MIYKPKKCKACGEIFTPVRQIQPTCMPPKECSWEYIKMLRAKKLKSQWSVEKKELKAKLKTLSEWKKDLQTEINNIVRLIDYGQACIATGNNTGKMNAGHMIAVGANDTIRFNLHNIHIQSEHSNTFKGGDNFRYQLGIEKIYGREYLEKIKSLHSTPEIKLTTEDVKKAISVARGIVKELKAKSYVYDSATRVELREYYNNQIGIYK